jgi:hypothetical protein
VSSLYDTFPYDTLFFDDIGAAFIPSPETFELDRLRIVDFPYRGSRPRTLLDINDGATYSLVRDTFKITPGEKQQQFSQLVKRYGGQKITQEVQNNGQIAAEWYISGAGVAAALNAQETFLTYVERIAGTLRYIEWRPDGAANSVFFEVRAGLPWEPMYSWIETVSSQNLHLKAAFSVAPLARGDTMFMVDQFTVDSIADYTQKAAGGGQAIGHVTITPGGSWGGSMGANSGAVTSQTYLFENSRTGYNLADQECTSFHQVGSTINGVKFGSYMKARYDTGGAASHTYIRVYVDDDGANSRLRIDKIVDGVATNMSSVNLAARIASAAPFYVRGRIEGAKVYAEYYLPPTAAPDSATRTQGTSWLMDATARGQFGASIKGKSGIVMTFQNKTGTVDKTIAWECRPYTYRNNDATGAANVLLPEDFKIAGIYGTAPSLCDLQIRESAGATASPVFGLVGWTPEPGVENFVHNGDFEDDYDGWHGGATGINWPTIAGLTTTVNSWSRNGAVGTPSPDHGAYAFTMSTAATTNSGVVYPIFRRFKKGVTYTFAAYTYGTAKPMGVGIGTSADKSEVTFASSAAWTLRTTTWTPATDLDVAYVFYRQTDATGGGQHYLDGVTVYEGTTAPTRSTQSFGRGAMVPFGILDGARFDTSGSTNPGSEDASVAANCRLGYGVARGLTEYFIDPAALTADDFSEDEVQVEFWARVALSSAMAARYYTLSAYPEGGTAYGSQRYTAEYGTTGKPTPALVSSGSEQYRILRLGTLTFRIDPQRPARWKLRLDIRNPTGAGGAVIVDYLVAVPILRRALSPTGKQNLATSYPRLFSTTGDITKLVHTDLWGEILKTTGLGVQSAFPDHGLGGTFIELTPPDSRAVVKLSSLVPDDPTVDATTEVLQHSSGVTFDVTPRYFLTRND